VSVHLQNHSESDEFSALKFEIKIIDKFGATKKAMLANRSFGQSISRGFKNFIFRSVILDESNNILHDNGSLAIVISIKEPMSRVFFPKYPFQDLMQDKCFDEETSDVCFELSTVEASADGTRRARSLIPYHAHRSVLQICAPMLAALFGESAVASVNDINPDVFHYMLWYVYGGQVEEDAMTALAKEIMDAADKYSIVNLKLEAEAAYVNSTTITADNVMDNLLYADAKNCALLKEAVMDFLADNGGEVIGNVSFAQFPPHLVNDLLVATTRRNEGNSRSDDNFTTMRVSELRRKLHEQGLDLNVHSSGEAMIEALQNSTAES
jgi:hypothetical protein